MLASFQEAPSGMLGVLATALVDLDLRDPGLSAASVSIKAASEVWRMEYTPWPPAVPDSHHSLRVSAPRKQSQTVTLLMKCARYLAIWVVDDSHP